MSYRISRNIIENDSVRELVRAKKSGLEDALVSCLQTCDTYYPRIMSAIFTASPTSLLSELLRKFETSASIFTLITKLSGKRKSIHMLRASINAYKNIQLWRFHRVHHDYLHPNWFIPLRPWRPPRLSGQLRMQWGQRLCGVTKTPNEHLLNFTYQDESMTSTYAINNHYVE